MPIYEYRCKQCGQQFEQLVLKRSDTIACPFCNGQNVQKRFSTFGMKSADTFVSSSGSSCSTCSSHACSTCGH
jgi:putative FmdB family regulatory protein